MIWIERIKNWVHDSLVVLGSVVVALLLGAADLAGYYFDYGFIRHELIETSKPRK